jgi:hypothetical protein
MIAEDKSAFAQLVLAAADKYRRQFTQNFLEIYWHCLKQFSLRDIQAAFVAHFQNPDNGHFMPQPSDIIRILQGDSQTQALEAWSKVMHAISGVGAYDSIVFDDCLIHVVISDMEGWVALCHQTVEELKFRGIEFQKRYRRFLLRRPQRYPNRLIGIHEHQRQLHGYPIPSPQLFGNAQAAFITYSEGCEPHLTSPKVTLLSQFMDAIPPQLKGHQTPNRLTQSGENNALLTPIIDQKSPCPLTNSPEPSASVHPNTGDPSHEE